MMIIISIIAGGGIALQSSISSRLGQLINNPIMATFSYFFSSTILLGLYLALKRDETYIRSDLINVPGYYWILGGLISSIALSIIYWQVPKMGLSKVITGVLVGQLLTSSILSHFGIFQLPKIPLNTYRIVGFLLLICSTILINRRI
jgi:transporter family-2 protein